MPAEPFKTAVTRWTITVALPGPLAASMPLLPLKLVELSEIATSLRIETGKVHSRLELLIRLLRHLDRYYNQFLVEGAGPIVRRFAEVSSYFQGKRVRISTAIETFTGTTAGLESSGVLRVARDDGRGIEPILSGDVAEAS